MDIWPILEMVFVRLMTDRGSDLFLMTIFFAGLGVLFHGFSKRLKELKSVIPSLARQADIKQLELAISEHKVEVNKKLLDLDEEYTERMKTWTSKTDRINENVHRIQGRCETRQCLPHNSNWGNNSHS